MAATGGMLAATTRCLGTELVHETNDIASTAARSGRKRSS
jgi:hypothetical protein